MAFKKLILEKDIINIEQLQEYLNNYYPVEQRKKLKVTHPYLQNEYAIVREKERYCLVNLSTLFIDWFGNIGQSLSDFAECLCSLGYKVLVEMNEDKV